MMSLNFDSGNIIPEVRVFVMVRLEPRSSDLGIQFFLSAQSASTQYSYK